MRNEASAIFLPNFVCRINWLVRPMAHRNIECGSLLRKCDETLPSLQAIRRF
jgi:hypothetical protein